MSTNFNFNGAVQDSIGNDTIDDQYDIASSLDLVGTYIDGYMTGSIYGTGSLDSRAVSFSNFDKSENKNVPLLFSNKSSDTFISMSSISRNAFRNISLDCNERYYDSMLPAFVDMFRIGGGKFISAIDVWGLQTGSYAILETEEEISFNDNFLGISFINQSDYGSAVASNKFWGVGENGAAYEWFNDGSTKWGKIDIVSSSFTLRAVDVGNPVYPGLNEILAVGDKGLILDIHLSPTPSQIQGGGLTTNNLNGLFVDHNDSASSTFNAFVVGDNGTILTSSYVGVSRTWKKVISPYGNSLYGVWGYNNAAATNKVWAVGTNERIISWDSTTHAWTSEHITVSFTTVATLRSVCGNDLNPPTKIVAVGDLGTIISSPGGGVATWNHEQSPTSENLNAIVSGSGAVSGFWTVGNAGTILNGDNVGNWTTINSITSNNLHAIKFDDVTNTLWILGEKGTVIKYDGLTWELIDTTAETFYNGTANNSFIKSFPYSQEFSSLTRRIETPIAKKVLSDKKTSAELYGCFTLNEFNTLYNYEFLSDYHAEGNLRISLQTGSLKFRSGSYGVRYLPKMLNLLDVKTGSTPDPLLPFGGYAAGPDVDWNEKNLIKLLYGFGSEKGKFSNNFPVLYQSASTVSTQYNTHPGCSISGWKYGLRSGLPTYAKAVWRRDKYGQFRDLLEQRIDSKFLISAEGKENYVNKSPVEVIFTDLSGNPVDAELTQSSNLNNEVTSSVPYFDGQVKNR